MTLELVGLPGVGKSTLARTLEQHGLVKVRVNGRADLLWSNLRYLLRYPIAFFKLFFEILRSSLRHGRFYPLFMNVFLDTNARIWKAHQASSRTIVDQGNLQGLLSLSHHPLTSREVERFLRYLPKPDLVIVLSLSEAERRERLTARGYGPREGERGQDVWRTHLAGNLETLVDTAMTLQWAPIEIIPAHARVEEIARTVLEKITARI